MTKRYSHHGFTLIELVVVIVLGSVVALAAYSVMQGGVRGYTVMGARVQVQQAVRGSTDVLFGELREISPSGGDLLAMGQDSVVIRSMRTFGVICEVTPTGTPVLRVRRFGRGLQRGDSVFLLADNNPDLSPDDVWLQARVGTVDSNATCASGDAAQEITLPGMAAAMEADTVRSGAPIRSFTRYSYGLHEVDGGWYLARRGTDGVIEPMVGPLDSRAARGLRFAYFDELGAVTSVATEVAEIRVSVRASSTAKTPAGAPLVDSVIASVHPRN